MTGRSIAHYKVGEEIGQGGMGIVYKAFDTHLDRFVALKVLSGGIITDSERRSRFVQEAKAASALNHPSIITVHDIGRADDIDFIAMEYVSGKTLGELIGRKGMPVADVLKYAIQIADGLAVAHRAGIIHRDLKPANIMVTDQGLVKILDFGLAKLTGPATHPEAITTESVAPKTTEGRIAGTVAYMSPEQAEGRAVDERSDIFSFGAVLYEMLTGCRAFQRESTTSTLAAILKDEPKPVSEIVTDIPEELGRVLTRCLRKDRNRRLQYIADVKVALEDLVDDLRTAPVKPAGSQAGLNPIRCRRHASRVLSQSFCCSLSLALEFWKRSVDGAEISMKGNSWRCH